MEKTDRRAGYVILDRDGTIIVNKHYQKDPAITELLPNAREGLEALRKAGFRLVMVTNQSGVGRGYMTLEDVDAVNRSVVEKLGAAAGHFEGVYVCPHVDADGCDCRKPRPGMVLSAAADLGFSPEECYVVGDRDADVEMGKAVGARTVLVRTGYGAKEETREGLNPDFVADDLLDAAEWIISLTPP